ncbi:MAG: exonuclease subunit SbcD [Muribaculaceae bacterium]|nr:exonuclease subunit SbcD [Muribaculaceae bacterium]
MNILHTGDWHLGHILYDYDRIREHAAMVESLIEIAAREQPDLMLLCGDVYDTSQPSAQAQRLLADALSAMRKAAPDMDIVVIAGNHDSPSRHEVFSTPWKALGVHMAGRIGRDSGPADLVIEIPGKCFVAAVPFASGRNMPENIYVRIMEYIDQRNKSGLPVVIAAHTAVIGSLCEGHRHDEGCNHRPDVIGGVEAVSLGEFGRGYDYLALGHIHRRQPIAGSEGKAYYAGSPLPISFDEPYSHGVILARVEHGEEPIVQEIDIEPLVPIESLPANRFASWPEAREMLMLFPAGREVYLRLNVEVDEKLSPTASTEAGQICSDKKVRFCQINLHRPEPTGNEGLDRELRIEEFRELAPIDIADRYAADQNLFFGEELRKMFRDVAEQCSENDNED